MDGHSFFQLSSLFFAKLSTLNVLTLKIRLIDGYYSVFKTDGGQGGI
ncbi:Uncharacterised protein [Legionella londiniensis]|nr:Uncharacterised protein [Legionella londiniensis]